jgi:hypothetical protein
MTATNIAATATANNNAKAKPLSKAQRIRNNATKAIAKANKDALDLSIEEAIAKAVYGTKQGEAACRVLAFALERDFGMDWYIMDSGNMRSDNEKAVFARLEEHRRQCQDLSLERGLSNINKPWSDAKKVQKEKNLGGRPAERIVKQWDNVTHDALRKRYKDGMKEGRLVTENELDLNIEIGRLLVRFFNEDLSKLG